MNEKQKWILAVIVPIIVLIIVVGISDSIPTGKGSLGRTLTTDPFDFEDTWGIWFIGFIVIGIFEYKLFKDRNNGSP